MRMDRRELARVARLYHLEGITQPQIARRLGISVPTVSRALARAAEEGIVRITIQDDDAGLHELERAVERRHPGLTCRVAPTSGRRDVTLGGLAGVGARYLQRALRRGELLGVSWGETLRGIAEALPDLGRLRVNTIPLLGSIGTIETGIYPSAIAQAYARKLGGSAYLVNAPGVVDSAAARAALLRDSGFASVRKLWDTVDAALLGVSAVDAEASIARSGALSAREIARLGRAGVACATNFNFLRADGSPADVPLAHRLIVMGIESLRRLRMVVLVAVGAEKAIPIRTALAAGIGNVLFTDEEAARALLGGRP